MNLSVILDGFECFGEVLNSEQWGLKVQLMENNVKIPWASIFSVRCWRLCLHHFWNLRKARTMKRRENCKENT